MHPVRRKWRPGLGLVILAVLALVLCLPIAGLFLFRFYANQLVQQTEESLLMQAAVLTAAYEQLYRDAAEVTDTPQLPAISPQTRSYQPLFPSVTMNPQAILPPRPDPLPATEAIGAAYTQIGPQLSRIALRAQEQTLAGYRFLDRHGTVIAGSAEDGTYLGHVNEVAMALNGDVASVARTRVRPAGEPLLYRLSQGTRVRIFVAMPAMVGEDIIGVVYLSRTPNHIFRFLYGERWNLLQAAVFVLLSTGAIGFVFWRFVSQPIRALIRRTDGMQAASRWEPLAHYGTREVETLARSFQALTERLHHQRDTLTTYTAHVSHEMKSPLTSIKGAAELMQDNMPPEARARFLDNIRADAARIEDLLARMRDYSAVGAETLRGECMVRDSVPSVAGLGVSVTPKEAIVPIPGDVLAMILIHLLENAADHGATSVQIDADARGLTITDDGRGISEGNRARVFEPFFTTRRGAGGTGMGLNIVRSGVEAAGGAITLEPSAKGARFRITFAA